MIVRNEAHVIERCLDSAARAIDALDLCDTGSTDDTVRIVRRRLKSAGIPGRIHRHPFVDFGHNRTRSLQSARRTTRALGWQPAETYLLMLDADMVLGIDASFSRERLIADAYRVTQHNGALSYPNVRLVRASVPCRFVGATHEYLDLPEGTAVDTLDALSIDDLNDGGARTDKYARDERLLSETLERDPQNHRAMFYLAQTYRAMGERAKAMAWYRRRTEAGGWHEEVWYAQYAIGQILAEAGAVRDAVRALVTALRSDRGRPEPYRLLAALLRTRRHFLWATRLAEAGLALGVPRNRTLFIDRDACDWGLLHELSVAAFHTPHRSTGAEANERLALGIGTPVDFAQQAVNNAVFYAVPLVDASYSPIRPALSPLFAPCNPSIVRTDDGYRLNCRTVSYRLDAYQRYRALEADGIFRTRNVLMRLDRDLAFIDQQEIVSAESPLRETTVRGLEDCRLVAMPEGLALTCTTTEFHPAGPVRVSFAHLGEDGTLRRLVPLTGHGDEYPQKNWLPLTASDSPPLRAVYSYAPFVVLAVDTDSGRCHPVVEHDHGRPFDSFRGSAGPVDLPAYAGGGRLILVHEVAVHHGRTYLHRFVRVDEDWQVTAVSRSFFFRHRGIEFACGACLSHDGDLLITFGVEDREAWLCRVSLSTVAGLLRPLPDWPPVR